MKTLLVLLTFTLFTSNFAFADRVKLLSKDEDALQARVDLIQQAKSEILVEYFSVWNDDQAVAGTAVLLEAARRGVKVKLVIDALANKLPKSFFTTLTDHAKDAQGNVNIEFRLYNPFTLNLHKLTRRDHAKLLIVDGERMITGGRNIGDKYFGFNKKRNFKDLDVMIEGDAVQAARDDFMAVFNSRIVKNPVKERNLPSQLVLESCERSLDRDRQRCARRRDAALRTYKETLTRIETTLQKIVDGSLNGVVKSHTGKDWLKDIDAGADIEFISHKPDELVTKDTAHMTQALAKLVSSAQYELNIMSPYLVPTPEVAALLQELIYRGVKIRFVTNSLHSTDNYFAQAAYLANKDAMIKMGIEIYEYSGPDTAHGKGFVMDNKVAFVGTFNLDPRSMYLNREVGVIIRNSPKNRIINELNYEIEQLRKNSLLVGQDGRPQNVEEQKRRYKNLSAGKRALLNLIELFVPVFKNQVY